MNSKVPAIPPDNYSGTIADWVIALQQRGLLKGTQFYGNIKIPKRVYDEVLAECEEGNLG